MASLAAPPAPGGNARATAAAASTAETAPSASASSGAASPASAPDSNISSATTSARCAGSSAADTNGARPPRITPSSNAFAAAATPAAMVSCRTTRPANRAASGSDGAPGTTRRVEARREAPRRTQSDRRVRRPSRRSIRSRAHRARRRRGRPRAPTRRRCRTRFLFRRRSARRRARARADPRARRRRAPFRLAAHGGCGDEVREEVRGGARGSPRRRRVPARRCGVLFGRLRRRGGHPRLRRRRPGARRARPRERRRPVGHRQRRGRVAFHLVGRARRVRGAPIPRGMRIFRGFDVESPRERGEYAERLRRRRRRRRRVERSLTAPRGSITRAIRGYRPSTDGTAPSRAATTDQRRSASIHPADAADDGLGRAAAAPLVDHAPNPPHAAAADCATAEGIPSAPIRRACSGADAATTRSTRVAAAAEPGGYEGVDRVEGVEGVGSPLPVGFALASACGYTLVATATRTGMSRGHLATAVAASRECLAAAVSMSSAGAIAAGWRPTSRRYLSRGSNPMRNIDATGSAACAIPRDFRRSADMPPAPLVRLGILLVRGVVLDGAVVVEREATGRRLPRQRGERRSPTPAPPQRLGETGHGGLRRGRALQRVVPIRRAIRVHGVAHAAAET